MSDDGLRHCLDLLRGADPDRYLACLWQRQDWRISAAALYAFNAEVDRIPERVSEPAPGEIRLQWWCEVIEGKRETGGNPVADALRETITRHDLPVAALTGYLEARIFDLYHDTMPDRANFEGYCGETASALLVLAAQGAGARRGPDLADACGHGGVAQTIAAVLRATNLHRRQKRCYVPADMLSQAGLTVEGWLDDTPDERHLGAVSAMIAWGRDHLAKAYGATGRLDAELRPVFLPLAPVGAYLDRAERAGLAIFSRPPDISPLKRQWIFAKAALTRR